MLDPRCVCRRGQPAAQSSTFEHRSAQAAVTGPAGGAVRPRSHCATTDVQASPWWSVDVTTPLGHVAGTAMDVRAIVWLHGSDAALLDALTCTWETSGGTASLSRSHSVVGLGSAAVFAGRVSPSCDGTTVRVTFPGTARLHVAAVQVLVDNTVVGVDRYCVTPVVRVRVRACVRAFSAAGVTSRGCMWDAALHRWSGALVSSTKPKWPNQPLPSCHRGC